MEDTIIPVPNYHSCDQITKAEKDSELVALHINHGGAGWHMTSIYWGNVISIPAQYCPFCGEELPK